MNPEISVNIINLNSWPYTRNLLESIHLLTDNFDTEIVVVDSYSDDRSGEKLEEIADIYIEKETTRGEARNLALEKSSAPVIIDQIDADQKILKAFVSVIDWYLDKMPDFCLKVSGMVNRRDLVKDIGWGNYQLAEDKVMWDGLIERDKLRFLKIATLDHPNGSQGRTQKDIPREKMRYNHNPDFNYPNIFYNKIRDKEIEEEVKERHKKIWNEEL